jgi:hypothetical protein
MRHATLFWLVFAITISAAGASEPTSARYAFVPVEAGALRLDSVTGEVAFCTAEGGAVVCTAAAEDSAAPSGEPSRLEARVVALEERPSANAIAERQAASP